MSEFKVLSWFLASRNHHTGWKQLRGFNDLACLNTAGAYVDLSNATLFNHCTDALKVGVESSFVQIVGMTDIITNHWFLTANCALF